MKIFKKLRERKLSVEILSAFSALICITVACEIFYSSSANKELVLRFEKDHYSRKISNIATSWLNSYFKQIELIISVLSKNKIFLNESSADLADYEELFKEGLKRTPFALSYYVGLKDGTYLQVFAPSNIHPLKTFQSNKTKKLPSYVSYAIQRMEKAENGNIVESWEYFNDDFTSITKETLNKLTFLPRKRIWYTQAEQARQSIWTDIYVFKTTGVPGVTVASPIIMTEDGEVEGVIAVDFVLQEFKDLLSTVKSTENSSVRLISSKNEIMVSTSNDDTVKIGEDGEIILPKIVSTGDEVLEGAAKELLGSNEIHATYKISNGDEYVAYIRKLDRAPFSVLTITPLSDFTDSLDEIQQRMALLSILVLIIAFFVVFWLSRRISLPIFQLCKSAEAIGEMNWENYPTPPKSNIFEIQQLSSAMEAMKLSISTFSKYAPKDLVRKLLEAGTKPELGGMTKDITILFSDIERFTTVSEKLPAEYLVLHLSEYFDELTQNIMEHGGIIDKYIGDAIMAMWGATTPDENRVIHACEAALDCQEILKKLERKWAPLGKPPLPTRIGIHTGKATVGNIGAQDKMNFTAIGNSVEIASSLEGINKIYGTKILASESVEAKARSKILFRIIDRIAIEGISSGITIFEPLCSINSADDRYYDLIELCSKSKEAFELFQATKFRGALKLYNEIMKAFPEKASSIIPLINRCKAFITTPPKNWDGINFLENR